MPQNPRRTNKRIPQPLETKQNSGLCRFRSYNTFEKDGYEYDFCLRHKNLGAVLIDIAGCKPATNNDDRLYDPKSDKDENIITGCKFYEQGTRRKEGGSSLVHV